MVLPRVGRLAIKPFFPLALVPVRQALLRRHDEAVIEQAHDAIGRLSYSVELYPADEGLVAQRDELCRLRHFLIVVGGDEFAVFA